VGCQLLSSVCRSGALQVVLLPLTCRPACLTVPPVRRELGGEWRAQRRYTHACWLAAAAAPGPSQPPAFARLGDFYRDVAGDAARARRCYQRALALDPLQASAGVCGALASCLA
jgi:hypothetical protein